MQKRIFLIVAALLLLSACSKQVPENSTPAASEQSDSLSPAAQSEPAIPSPVTEDADPTNEYAPDIWCSISPVEGSVVIASLDSEWIENPVYVYLYVNEPAYDVFISELIERTGDEPLEMGGLLYVPELHAGQTVKLINPYPSISDTESYYTRIAYTNSAGEYEAFLLHGDREKENPALFQTEPGITGALYDEDYLGSEQFIVSDLLSAEFREKTLAGEFDDFVPKGFRIASGTLGDVNGDGIQDALMYLLTDSRRIPSYSGVMPLFILTGCSEGGYSVEKKIPGALFVPYRSASYAVAGNGSIDIVYDYVGGAGCHHTQVCRFDYFPEKNDWILGGFSYQPTYDLSYTEEIEPGFVRPLQTMLELPLEKLSGGEYYGSPPDWSYFDEVCEFSSRDGKIYTLGVRRDAADGCYEGHIYMYYKSLERGGFIQTVRGTLMPGAKLEIYADAEDSAFYINQEVWKLDEHDSDSFHLINQP